MTTLDDLLSAEQGPKPRRPRWQWMATTGALLVVAVSLASLAYLVLV